MSELAAWTPIVDDDNRFSGVRSLRVVPASAEPDLPRMP